MCQFKHGDRVIVKAKDGPEEFPCTVTGSVLRMGNEVVTVKPDMADGSIYEKDGKRYRRMLQTFPVKAEYVRLDETHYAIMAELESFNAGEAAADGHE